MKKLKLKETDVLVLRNVKKDMTSHGGFKWPEKGFVKAADWKDNYECGKGLHGLPWGVGGVGYLYNEPCIWLVVKVDTTDGYNYGHGDMTDKCKFRRGEVVYCGDRDSAIKLITTYAPQGLPINFATVTGGDGSTVTGGDGSTVTGGYRSTVTGGDGSTVTGGDRSTVTGGDESKLKGGKGSVLIYRTDMTLKTKIIDSASANKFYTVRDGDWVEVTE